MQNAAMIEFLQKHRYLVDTNVWLKASFRSAGAWRKHCETDAQRKAIDSIIDAAKKKN